jgi:DNA-binding transcriptional ArsR family regulator
MVNHGDKLDATFTALSDPTRRGILSLLAEGDRRKGLAVGELAAPFAMSLPAISKHLRVLERAGLLAQERDGRIRRCHLQGGPLKAAGEWIEQYRQFWTSQLDALADFLEQADSPADAADQPESKANDNVDHH